jgi:hypothetical protein
VSARDPAPAGEPPLVRPYALVRGRTRHGVDAPLPVEAVIITTAAGEVTSLRLEREAIAGLCRQPCSIAEISAHLRLPIGVVRVLVAELASEGCVTVNLPLEPHASPTLDRSLLERVLAGLEAL